MIIPWGILGLFCAFLHIFGTTANGSEGSQDFVSRQEFEEFMKNVNSTLDLVLEALAKDVHLANTSRGMPGVNLNQVTSRLAETEKILKTVHPQDLRNHVFFGTHGGGIQVYSEEFNDVQTFVESSENLAGVAWDDENQKLYYFSQSKIFRVRRDGTGIQTVFSSTKYGVVRCLALDWITGNVYAVTEDGYVIACNQRASGHLKCSAILNGQGSLNGIAMNPNAGSMYLTSKEGQITRAEMDGSSNYPLLTGLNYPGGIVVDSSSDPSKLFWVEYKGNVVKSCDLDGSNVVTILNLPSGSYPWGLAILKDRLYWGQYWDYSLRSSRKNGEDVNTLYTGTKWIQHFTVAASNPNSTRQNPCEARRCPGICVLGRSGHTCRPQM